MDSQTKYPKQRIYIRCFSIKRDGNELRASILYNFLYERLKNISASLGNNFLNAKIELQSFWSRSYTVQCSICILQTNCLMSCLALVLFTAFHCSNSRLMYQKLILMIGPNKTCWKQQKSTSGNISRFFDQRYLSLLYFFLDSLKTC